MNKILRQIFPYIITIVLWYLANPLLNPFGVLSIIPIFYYTYERPAKNWFFFGLLMCFLLDFNAETLFLFSSLFLIAKSINDFFGVMGDKSANILNTKGFGIFLLAAMTSLLIKMLFDGGAFWRVLFGTIWMYSWVFLLYFPFAWLFKRIEK